MRLKRQSHFPPTDNDPFYHSDEWIQGYNTAKNEDNQQIKYCFEQFYEKSRKVK